ncbi:MAG: carbonate dehydratase [Acidobacteriota bacterium]|nr:carbonate dehydratase [Acidobacteriota bacterium]
MSKLNHLLEQNRQWVESITAEDADFFRRLADEQSPAYLWIGCSDSRIPANAALGLMPGELFVHRNIANLVIHSDLNCLSVIQFAVEVLKVKHIIVCGHYNCGGVKAALENVELGLIDNWLRHIQDIAQVHEDFLNRIDNFDARLNKLCELNVIEQVLNAAETTFIRRAWRKGQEIAIHGWIYDLRDGLIQDLEVCIENAEQMQRLKRSFWNVRAI